MKLPLLRILIMTACGWCGTILSQELVFTDITGQAGIALSRTLTESIAWGDYDGDGDPDLYLTNNGPNKLFRNDGDGRFTDVTDQAGVGNNLFSVGAAFGDLDNDGDLDLYVVNFQTGPDVLYRNDGPIGPGQNPSFTDITAGAGITDESSSRGMAFLDFNRDGWLDIYVNAIGPDILYRNLGNFSFENVAGSVGLSAGGQGVGVVAVDVNRDGWMDIYNGNRSGDLSNLYINQGGTFVDVAEAAGITASGLGMGVIALDFDNDLDMDLYWTTWPGEVGPPVPNRLYRNDGDLQFTDVAAQTQTQDAAGWGISANAGDVDNDGWMDFFVTNGFSPSTGPNVLFRNQGGQSFEDITALLGGGDFDGRGVAFADFDRDGDLDLCVTGGPDDPSRLWRNDTPRVHHFLSFQLTGLRSNASAIGARIEVTAGGLTMVQDVSGGAGRGSFNSLPVAFGLADACVADLVEIFWPNGAHSRFENVPADRFLAVVEPVGMVASSYEVIASVPREGCQDCQSLAAVVPWVVDNEQFSSRLAFFNDAENPALVCLEATTAEGQTRNTTITIPAKAVTGREAGELFDGLSGYSLAVRGADSLHATVLTYSRESPSGRSPSQTTAVQTAQLTGTLLFSYVPGSEISAIVIVAPERVGETTVQLSLYDEQGAVMEQSAVTLQDNRPGAFLLTDLFSSPLPADATLRATAEVDLAGLTFVFNQSREPSLAKAVNL